MKEVNKQKKGHIYAVKKKRSKKERNPLTAVYLTALAVVIIGFGAYAAWQLVAKKYSGEEKWVYIPADATEASVKDSLQTLGDDFGSDAYRIWKLAGGKPSVSHGAYKVVAGERAYSFARRLKNGRQNPVKLTFNNIRTLSQLSDKVSSKMEFSAEDFVGACNEVLPKWGYGKTETFPAAFLPDSYEFYWSASASKVVETLVGFTSRFWNDERTEKAKSLGLTPVEVATIASIVEEESSKTDERPQIARLYLNRLAIGMPLQADPTVKFAVGDFSLRRIRSSHLQTESPYNTYIHRGLPPGPIRIVDGRTVDQVLDAPKNNYLYMCAREDFSGYHNFASDLETHNANARRYRAELNKRGI